MNRFVTVCGLVALCSAFSGTAHAQRLDKIRNVKRGALAPSYRMTAVDGGTVDSSDFSDKTVVLVYLSAEQRSSERAVADAFKIVSDLGNDDVRLVFVTADVVHKSYFEKFWKEAGIKAPLGFDAGRELYGKLGLIVFPTTLVIDREGRLAHVIATRRSSYPYILETFVRHALGEFDDEKLAARLKAQTFDRRTPMSLASRHRAAARLLREKGLLSGAEKELREALKYAKDDVSIRLDLGDLLLLMSGRAQEAEAVVDKVLSEEPRHRRAKLLKGITLFRTQQLDQAEKVLIEALDLNPDPARAHYYLGRIHEARGQKESAIAHYRKALARLLKE